MEETYALILAIIFIAQVAFIIYKRRAIEPDVSFLFLESQAIAEEFKENDNETCIYRTRHFFVASNSDAYAAFKKREPVVNLPNLNNLSDLIGFLNKDAQLIVKKLALFIKSEQISNVLFLIGLGYNQTTFWYVQLALYLLDDQVDLILEPSELPVNKSDSLLVVTDCARNCTVKYKYLLNLDDTPFPGSLSVSDIISYQSKQELGNRSAVVSVSEQEMMHAIAAWYGSIPFEYKINGADSFLAVNDYSDKTQNALAHLCVYSGAEVIYQYVPDAMSFLDACCQFEPSILLLNQDLMYKLYHTLNALIDRRIKGMSRLLFKYLREEKEFQLRCGCLRPGFLEGLLLGKIREQTLSRIRIIYHNGFVVPEVSNLIRIIFNCQVISIHAFNSDIISTSTLYGDYTNQARAGYFVGAPVANVEYKLVQSERFPFIRLEGQNPRGEIVIKSGSGWTNSKYLGEVYPNGSLRILGHLDEFIKTAGNDLISVSKLRAIYMQSPYIEAIYNFEIRTQEKTGKSSYGQQGLFAKLDLNSTYMLNQMKSMSYRQLSMNSPEYLQSLCNDVIVQQIILDDCNRLAVKYDLKPFQILRSIQVIVKERDYSKNH